MRPDVYVGIESPAFNLGLEKQLKAQGIRTVQYVSPQVWAWRQRRVRTIHKSCDLVLCLLPFETDFYAQQGARAVFVGHPLADQIPLEVDRAEARRALGIDDDSTVIALLPGSRMGDVARLGADFAAAAAWIAQRTPSARLVAPMASARVRQACERQLTVLGLAASSAAGDASAPVPRSHAVPEITLLDGQALRALAASDGVIVAC